jgi:hypothetical protein
MRTVSQSTAHRPAALSGRVVTALHRVVTGTEPSHPLGIARIVFGAAVLLKAWDIRRVVIPLLEPDAFLLPYWQALPSPTPTLVVVLLALWVLSGLAFTLGWRTRGAATVMTATIAAVFLLDQQVYSNHLYLMLLVAVLFALTGSGAAFSLDARKAGGRDRVRRWPISLLRVQVSVVYGFAAVAKLNRDYVTGDVLDVYLRSLGPLDFPVVWQRPGVLVTLALLSIAVEGFLAFGFWHRRLRAPAVVVGLVFHAAIVATMRPRIGLTVFGLVMASLYPLFFDRGLPDRRVRGAGRRRRG